MNRAELLKALRDTAQSASNAIASNVSGPVDLIAAALRAGGLDIQQPVGGSEWMQKKGFTAPVEMGAPRIIGETLGMAGPAVVAAKAPQIAAGLNRAGANLAAPRTLHPQKGAIVWHGSPHKFDKFDSSKIGTGEGAQAYGHGLYLAEKQGVAQEYADALGKEVLIKGKPAYQAKTGAQAADLPVSNAAAGHLRMSDWDLQKALKMAEDDFVETGDQWFSKVHKELSTLSPNDITVNRGQMYKVDLPDEHIAKMLDWDKPLSQQAPEVQAALQNSGLLKYSDAYFSTNGNKAPTGADLHDFLKYSGYDQNELAAKMADQGITGIRYLDSASRGAGQGTSNFVVFPGNESLLKILERNGQPLGLMGVK